MTTLDELIGSRVATIVPDVIGGAAAADLRTRLAFTRYALLNRGSYESGEVNEPALCESLVAIAARLTDRALAVAHVRALRFEPGDYLLAHHDRPYERPTVELLLELSPAPAPGEVHYRRRGQVFFRVSSVPGSLAVVERGPTTTRNHTYISKRCAACAIRIEVVLVDR